MATKRAYKLQEFVAHDAGINCLKIGRKTSRILATGGEDNKVNLWAVGKPNAILGLSGLTSPVESVSFDSSEVLVAAGAASGTIKLWDLEEAKIVRSFTGHRSNCMSIDFHPFGEFFASGSLDTNLKIWDIRRKGCIHTYKGHTRGVNVLRFTPDGRWVVSGGEDNSVKVWDLTARKLLHDFKFHEGQIQCLVFHPHEFLLATGSSDKTVKFWDLETFELIGSSGPESSVVCSMTFNSDGKTLFCGLHESMKVLSWEPVRCHDVVDVGWSRLVDLNVHEGKLLGCSANQSSVRIWVVDLSLVKPYASRNDELKSNASINPTIQSDSSIMAGLGRLSVSRDSAIGDAPGTHKQRSSSVPSATSSSATTTLPKRNPSKTPSTINGQIIHKTDAISASPPRTSSKTDMASECRKETANVAPSIVTRTSSRIRSRGDQSAASSRESCAVPVVVPRTSLRVDLSDDPSREASTVVPEIGLKAILKGDLIADPSKETGKLVRRTRPRVYLDADLMKEANVLLPTIPSTSLKVDLPTDFGREKDAGRVPTYAIRSRSAASHIKYMRDESERDCIANENDKSNEIDDQFSFSVGFEKSLPAGEHNMEPLKFNKTGKLRTSKLTGTSQSYNDGQQGTRSTVAILKRNELAPPFEDVRGRSVSEGKETVSFGDEDVIANLMEQHKEFIITGRSRLTKIQVVHRLWQKNDIRGVINAMQKMSDYAISSDVVSVLMEKSDIITLDICTCLLPLLSNLLESRFDRHMNIALEMLLKLIKSFGPTIKSTLSAPPSVGVDLQAEQRLERCNLCFIELEKAKSNLPSIIRRGGSIGNSAQELNLAFKGIFE